jgi:hypothetical protein
MRLAEAVARVRNRVGQRGHGIDNLYRKRALCLKLLADVVLHHFTQRHEVSQASLFRNILANVCLVEPFKTRVAQRCCTVVWWASMAWSMSLRLLFSFHQFRLHNNHGFQKLLQGFLLLHKERCILDLAMQVKKTSLSPDEDRVI